jgi:hypothetical protein
MMADGCRRVMPIDGFAAIDTPRTLHGASGTEPPDNHSFRTSFFNSESSELETISPVLYRRPVGPRVSKQTDDAAHQRTPGSLEIIRVHAEEEIHTPAEDRVLRDARVASRYRAVSRMSFVSSTLTCPILQYKDHPGPGLPRRVPCRGGQACRCRGAWRKWRMPFCRRLERGAGSSDEANSVVEPAEHVGMRIGCTSGFCFPGPDREVVGNRNGRASPRADVGGTEGCGGVRARDRMSRAATGGSRCPSKRGFVIVPPDRCCVAHAFEG